MLSLKKLEPILYFNNNTLESQIEALKNKENIDEETTKKIKRFQYGVDGEKKVLYELINSDIGMYILHDINICFKNQEAQIDFLIMTEKSVYVIECKQLYGNITIDNKGNFIRELEWKGRKNKEGMYNPLTQCERHISLLKKICYSKYNTLEKLLYKNRMNTLFTPIVVLANNKTILNDYYAPNEIKQKIVRVDQLVKYIKKKESTKTSLYSEKYIKNYCDSLLTYQVDSKYVSPLTNVEVETENIPNQKEAEKLREDLKKYRIQKSREDRCKPYFIFKDITLEKLIEKRPKSKEELLNIEGLGEYKVEKYGEDILELINKL